MAARHSHETPCSPGCRPCLVYAHREFLHYDYYGHPLHPVLGCPLCTPIPPVRWWDDRILRTGQLSFSWGQTL